MKTLRNLIKLAAALLIFALTAGMMGQLHPALDSFSHFRLHLATILALVVVVAVLVHQRKLAIFSSLVIAASLFQTVPHLPFFLKRADVDAADQIKIMQLNLLFKNTSYEHVARISLNSGADFITFQEVTSTTGRVLDLIRHQYPFQLSCAFGAVGSVAIASRHEFANSESKLCLRANGFAKASFSLNGQNITVASIHLHWPWPSIQSEQIGRISNSLNALSGPVLIAGDFNAAPWSAAVKRVAAESNTRVVNGVLQTWGPVEISKRLIPWIGLALDNTLHSLDLKPVDRRLLEDAKSDHFPVLTTFQRRS